MANILLKQIYTYTLFGILLGAAAIAIAGYPSNSNPTPAPSSNPNPRPTSIPTPTQTLGPRPSTSSPPSCPPNEKISDCYNECGNSLACDDVVQPKDRACTLECQLNKCDCIENYRRNRCGVCVPMAQCSASCNCQSDREEVKCVNSCNSTTCEHLSSASGRCFTYCALTCDCKSGYARDPNQGCIPTAECCVE